MINFDSLATHLIFSSVAVTAHFLFTVSHGHALPRGSLIIFQVFLFVFLYFEVSSCKLDIIHKTRKKTEITHGHALTNSWKKNSSKDKFPQKHNPPKTNYCEKKHISPKTYSSKEKIPPKTNSSKNIFIQRQIPP